MFSEIFYRSLEIRVEFSSMRMLDLGINEDNYSSLRCDIEPKESAFRLGFSFPTHPVPPVFKGTVLHSFFLSGQDTKLSIQ